MQFPGLLGWESIWFENSLEKLSGWIIDASRYELSSAILSCLAERFLLEAKILVENLNGSAA